MSASSDASPFPTGLKSKSYGTVDAIQSHLPAAQASKKTIAAIERHESARASFPENNVTNTSVDMRYKPAPDEDGPMKYEAFCKLIGIRPEVNSGSDPDDLEAASGLYHNIRHSYMAASSRHYWFEIFVYSALLAQVLLSANFIILGAVRGDHRVPIAILGAISVSIAGCLALIKGQGLPMRLRMERDSLWEVQLEAEELHWQIAAGKPVMFGDVKRIWSHYIQVKKDASLNHPDTWWGSPLSVVAGHARSNFMICLQELGYQCGNISVRGHVEVCCDPATEFKVRYRRCDSWNLSSTCRVFRPHSHRRDWKTADMALLLPSVCEVVT